MAISRAQLVKELEPGLNALFGLEYDQYGREYEDIFNMENSDRAFEEEVMLSGFGSAPTKTEGTAITYDDAQEVYTARYTMETGMTHYLNMVRERADLPPVAPV